jgi:hypothetical protein
VIAGERPSALATDVHRNPQQPDHEVCFFQAGGIVYGLWTVLSGRGATGVELAHNVRSPHEVLMWPPSACDTP